MKEFFRLLRRFVPPYKKYLIWALFLNLLSAILNIFSFALIIPILQILFKMDTKTYEFIPWDAAGLNMKDIAVNNFAGRLIDIADFRRFPGGDDPAESIFLFRLFCRDDSSPHGRGARHPCASV